MSRRYVLRPISPVGIDSAPQEAMMQDQQSVPDASDEMTIEEIELEWWEPLGCACDVGVDE